jgi:chromosome segregation ATPase
MRMTKEQMTERLAKVQQDRQTLAINIDQAVARLQHFDGQIQLLQELLAAETAVAPIPEPILTPAIKE